MSLMKKRTLLALCAVLAVVASWMLVTGSAAELTYVKNYFSGSVLYETDAENHWCHWSTYRVKITNLSPDLEVRVKIVEDKNGWGQGPWITRWNGLLEEGEATPWFEPLQYNSEVWVYISNPGYERIYYWGYLEGWVY